MSTPSVERPPLRIGNQEREAANAALSAHLDAGRLDVDEYGERYARASLARTRPELEALFVDLPAPHPTFAATPQPSWAKVSAPARRRFYPARLIPALFLLLPFAVIAVAASTGLWFLFFAIPIGFSIIGRGAGHRHHPHRPHSGWAR